MNKWQRLESTRQIKLLANGLGLGTKNVFDVVLPSSSTTKAYQLHTKPRTSKAVAKNRRASSRKILQHSVMGAILIWVHNRTNIIVGKLRDWVKLSWTGLSSLVILIKRKTVNSKPSTGNKNSKKISAWDRLFAYVALISLDAGFIYYVRDVWAILFCLSATALITKNFKS